MSALPDEPASDIGAWQCVYKWRSRCWIEPPHLPWRKYCIDKMLACGYIRFKTLLYWISGLISYNLKKSCRHITDGKTFFASSKNICCGLHFLSLYLNLIHHLNFWLRETLVNTFQLSIAGYQCFPSDTLRMFLRIFFAKYAAAKPLSNEYFCNPLEVLRKRWNNKCFFI